MATPSPPPAASAAAATVAAPASASPPADFSPEAVARLAERIVSQDPEVLRAESRARDAREEAMQHARERAVEVIARKQLKSYKTDLSAVHMRNLGPITQIDEDDAFRDMACNRRGLTHPTDCEMLEATIRNNAPDCRRVLVKNNRYNQTEGSVTGATFKTHLHTLPIELITGEDRYFEASMRYFFDRVLAQLIGFRNTGRSPEIAVQRLAELVNARIPADDQPAFMQRVIAFYRKYAAARIHELPVNLSAEAFTDQVIRTNFGPVSFTPLVRRAVYRCLPMSAIDKRIQSASSGQALCRASHPPGLDIVNAACCKGLARNRLRAVVRTLDRWTGAPRAAKTKKRKNAAAAAAAASAAAAPRPKLPQDLALKILTYVSGAFTSSDDYGRILANHYSVSRPAVEDSKFDTQNMVAAAAAASASASAAAAAAPPQGDETESDEEMGDEDDYEVDYTEYYAALERESTRRKLAIDLSNEDQESDAE